MKKFLTLIASTLMAASTLTVQAGNPDRQGEAGAYELLINPWARSTGLHSMVTSKVLGVEAMQINPAGLSRIDKFEILASRTAYLVGTGINMDAFGLAVRTSKKGVMGISLNSLDFGEIQVTTAAQPEGIGATYSPAFYNLGISYAHAFSERIHAGVTMRIISESISDVSAIGACVDAGIQYVTGPKKQAKFGVSLRNVGTPMRFSGEGLSFIGRDPQDNYSMTIEQRAARYELPTMLNIGASYDFLFAADKMRITVTTNFTSHSFSQDQFGGGLEFGFREMFALRAGYRYEVGMYDGPVSPVENGICAGVSLNVPMGKKTVNEDNTETKPSRLGLDYSYRGTSPFSGTHSIGLRLNF